MPSLFDFIVERKNIVVGSRSIIQSIVSKCRTEGNPVTVVCVVLVVCHWAFYSVDFLL